MTGAKSRQTSAIQARVFCRPLVSDCPKASYERHLFPVGGNGRCFRRVAKDAAQAARMIERKFYSARRSDSAGVYTIIYESVISILHLRHRDVPDSPTSVRV